MPALVDFQTIPELFFNLSEYYSQQQRTALRYKDKYQKKWIDISWDQYRHHVETVAGYLYAQGIRKGDRVAILSENRPEWTYVDLATQMLGAINVSLYTTLPPSEVAYILQDSGSKVFVVSTGIQLKKADAIFEDCSELTEVITMSRPRKERGTHVVLWEEVIEKGKEAWQQHKDAIVALRQSITPDDVAALIYTSGTTGNPKGVMLTHENFCSNAKAALKRVYFGTEDHHLSFLPLCHSFERTAGYHAVLASGAKISYAESVEAVSNNLLEVRPTVMISVPRLFEKVYNVVLKSVEDGSPAKKKIFNWAVRVGSKMAQGKGGALLKAQHRIAHKLVFAKLHEKLGNNLRFAVSGGAALPKAIGEFFQAAGIPVLEGYGLTETSPVLSVNPMGKQIFGTVGHILPGITVAIERLEDNQVLGSLSGEAYPSTLTTEEGEIIVKGPNIMKGYWNNEAETKKVIDANGWFRSGDVGKFEQGYLKITDRIRHMILTKGGKNIYPGPIEEKFTTQTLFEQIVIIGEAREFLTALVVPNMEMLTSFAEKENITYTQPSELLSHAKIIDLYKQVFKTYSSQAASHEKIRDFRFVPEEFTVENGLMTPTMKPKRKVISQHYQNLIEEMYVS